VSHPGNSGSFLQVLNGGEGEGVARGYPFLPSILERKNLEGENEKPPEGLLNLDRENLGTGTMGFLASYPGVFISHTEQGMKY
jgi:hypothetical protein